MSRNVAGTRSVVPMVGTTPTQEVLLVTPDMARRWLAQNTSNNRPLSQATVQLYARDMREGRWQLTHQGIAFNPTGELVDGQHRLHAIVMADIPIEMTVARGFRIEYDSPIDQGRNRSTAAIMHRSGRWVTIVRCLRHMSAGSVDKISSKASLGELQTAAALHQQAITAVYDALGQKLQGGVLAAIAWCLPLNPDAVLGFGYQVRDGEMLERGDPAFALRMWLSRHRRAPSSDHIYVTCSALRAVLEGYRLSCVVAGPTGYRWSCGRRRALRIPATPDTSVVSLEPNRAADE